MKSNISRQLFGLLLLLNTLLMQTLLAQPPAQGPPPPTAPIIELGTFIIINTVENSIQTTVDSTNARIQRDKPTSDVNAKISFSYKVFKPSMSVTTLPDKPNQNVVRIAFMVTYDVTDIRYKGIPYFSRKINQSIEVITSCKDWFTNNGLLNVSANIDPPYLDNASFAEQALNFFIGNTLLNYVDSKIRNTLPGAMRTSSNIPTSPCNCLSVNSGTEAQRYTDGAILFALKKGPRPPIGGGTTVFNNASVSLMKIKRLQARSFPGNAILYNEVEDIQFEFFANHTARVVSLTGFRENQEKTFNLPTIIFSKPKDDEMVVLIANIEQLPLTSAKKDTRFAVFKKVNSFGNGTQKLIITKSFWTKPERLPGGGMSKPREVKVNAYELTVQVTIGNSDVISKN